MYYEYGALNQFRLGLSYFLIDRETCPEEAPVRVHAKNVGNFFGFCIAGFNLFTA